MVAIKVTLLTGRSLSQGKAKELGKFSKEYVENVAVCELNPEDLKALGVSPGQNVQVKTAFGSVIVRAAASTQLPRSGVIFIPYGPWASAVADPETHGTGMPSLKGTDATVTPAVTEEVSSLEDLVKSLLGDKNSE
jgi:formylmethanofuran dehydrogenase subunit D